MKKIVITTNIPSPYRVALYRYMQNNMSDYHFDIIYSASEMTNRLWKVDLNSLENSYFLKGLTLEKEGKIDRYITYVSTQTGALLTKLDPDVVIAMEYNPVALQCVWWCKCHHRKLIHLTDGTVYSERNISLLQKLSRKIVFRAATACIASSTKAKEKCLRWGIPDNKIFVSLLTEDLNAYRKIVRNRKKGRILYVGSMVERKGLDLLLNALSKVKEPFELRIVGNGSEGEKAKLEHRLKQLQLEEQVTFAGFKEGDLLMEEYRQADLFVLPTREDCFGLVLLEAAAAGIPIVTSKYADGAYDILPITAESASLRTTAKRALIDPENAEEFAMEIEYFLHDTEEKEAYASWMKNNTENFLFEKTVDGYRRAIEYAAAAR